MKQIQAFFLAAILMLSATVPAMAANGKTEREAAAAYLREASIMLGNESGDMMLEQGLTRAQMAALLTRIVANPEHIKADSAFYRGQCSFTDVPDWAKVYVGYCAANHLVGGYGNGLYGPNDPVTSAAACTVMLRCLENVDADWSYSTACQTAVELGLAPADALAASEISRGNMAILICRTMTQMGYDVELLEATREGTPYTGEAPVKEAAPVEQPASEKAETIDTDTAKQDIIDRTNALRRKEGVAALAVDDQLTQAAQVRAEEMAASGVYSHTRPDGRSCVTVTDCKYVGENIHRLEDWALADRDLAETVIWSWSASAGHLKNMLGSRYGSIGIGLAHGTDENGQGYWYCVQLFMDTGCSISRVDKPAAK